MVKLKTINGWKANQSNSLAFAGLVIFNEKAEIEVDESIVADLIDFYPEFSLVEEEDIKKKSEDNQEINAPKEEEIKPKVEDAVEIINSIETLDEEINDPEEEKQKEEDSKQDLPEVLASKTLVELKDMAKEFPTYKTTIRTKQEHIDFLLESLK